MAERSNIYNKTAQDVINILRQLAILLAPPSPSTTPFLDYQLGQEKSGEFLSSNPVYRHLQTSLEEQAMQTPQSQPNLFQRSLIWANTGVGGVEKNPTVPEYQKFRDEFWVQ